MAGGGGAWKVAYADFVTAMMAFFMVMWLVSQNAKVREAVAEHFRESDTSSIFDSNGHSGSAVGRNRRGRHKGNAAGTNQTEPLDPDSELKNSKGGTTHDTEENGVSFLVSFPEDQAVMLPEVERKVEKMLPMILGKRFKLEIRAHSSRRPLPLDSPFKDAWDLCYQRCLYLMNHLIERGVEPERIRICQAGIYEPRSNLEDAKAEATNARVVVTMLAEQAKNVQNVRQVRDTDLHQP